jgi:hypothetical protein
MKDKYHFRIGEFFVSCPGRTEQRIELFHKEQEIFKFRNGKMTILEKLSTNGFTISSIQTKKEIQIQ